MGRGIGMGDAMALQPARSTVTDPSLALDLYNDCYPLRSCMAPIFLLNHSLIQKRSLACIIKQLL